MRIALQFLNIVITISFCNFLYLRSIWFVGRCLQECVCAVTHISQQKPRLLIHFSKNGTGLRPALTEMRVCLDSHKSDVSSHPEHPEHVIGILPYCTKLKHQKSHDFCGQCFSDFIQWFHTTTEWITLNQNIILFHLKTLVVTQTGCLPHTSTHNNPLEW